MHPARALVLVAGGLFLVALAASLWPEFVIAWQLLAAVAAILAVGDAVAVHRTPRIDVVRRLPEALALGTWARVELQLENRSTHRRVRLSIFDHPPRTASFRHLPQSVELPPESHTTLHYDVQPLERGTHDFARAELSVRSPLGLWFLRRRAGRAQQVKVYPNFQAVSQLATLALDNRVAALGIHRKRRRGQGLDFHQLREYREGDLLRQIDWKATSRRGDVISREYQDQRDQQLIFLLDCGQRMRATDGELSQFDHALNAVLLVSYLALREGDGVGVLTFGGPDRWFPPKKGAHVTTALLNQVFDLQPTLQPSDYAEASSRLFARQRRRALVVLVTNLREEDGDELPAAVRALRRRHLVVVASLREASVDAQLNRPIAELDDALTYAATRQYLASRRDAVAGVARNGVRAVDVLPHELPIALANKYLEIKRSGQL